MKWISVHEAGHMVVGKALNCELINMKPREVKVKRFGTAEDMLVDMAGWVAVTVVLKRSYFITYELFGGLGGGDQGSDLHSMQVWHANRGLEFDWRAQLRIRKLTAGYVRLYKDWVVRLADLHFQQKGHVSQKDLRRFFKDWQYDKRQQRLDRKIIELYQWER